MRVIILSLLLVVAQASAYGGDSAPLGLLHEKGHVLLLRHALAPGFGDPSHFDVNDCATQRNLSAEGINQAKMIGEQLRAAGLGDLRVYTSFWCRCVDTAEALDLTTPQRHPGLNSFFQQREKRDQIVTEMRELLASLEDETPAVLVTHQVNIRAVTGHTVRSGEGVIVRVDANGKLNTIGDFRVDL